MKSKLSDPKRPRSRPLLYGEKLVQTALWLTPAQRNKLQERAKQRGVTASELMRELIDKLE